MIYSHEVEKMCPVAQGVNHGAAPVPTEGKWVQNKKVEDISGFTHGVDVYKRQVLMLFITSLASLSLTFILSGTHTLLIYLPKELMLNMYKLSLIHI